MSDKFCGNCGTPIAPGTRFCHNCGQPVSAPQTDIERPDQALGEAAAQDLQEDILEAAVEEQADSVFEEMTVSIFEESSEKPESAEEIKEVVEKVTEDFTFQAEDLLTENKPEATDVYKADEGLEEVVSLYIPDESDVQEKVDPDETAFSLDQASAAPVMGGFAQDNFTAQEDPAFLQPQAQAQFAPEQSPAPLPSGSKPKKDLSKPLSTFHYFLMILLTMIPVIGLIVFIVWSLTDKVNKNRKNFSRAILLLTFISFVLFIIAAILVFVFWDALTYNLPLDDIVDFFFN